MIVDKDGNKSWSFLASLGAELLVISVMIVIPLIYGDHLPGFHWKSITVGPPVRSVPLHTARAQSAASSVRAVFRDPPRIENPFRSNATSAPAASEVVLDAPPGIQMLGGDGSGGSGPVLFQETAKIKPPTPPPAARPKLPAEPMRVSQGVQMAKLLRQVMPVYPALARNARISGVVHLVGIIAKDGTIRNLEVINGHPLLTRAAVEAVSQWVYKPTLLNGEPVEVICPIDVNFTLNH